MTEPQDPKVRLDLRLPRYLYERIKVVYRGIPNAPGFWVRCGLHTLPKKASYLETCRALKRFIPRDHEIVAVEAQ